MFETRIARSYEAMERQDLDAVMAGLADDVVFEFPGHNPMSGRHEGSAAVREVFRQIFEGLASMRFTVLHAAMANPVGLNWSNVWYVEWVCDEVTRSGHAFRNEGISVLRFRNGKVVHMRDYFADPAVVDAAWAAQQPVLAGA